MKDKNGVEIQLGDKVLVQTSERGFKTGKVIEKVSKLMGWRGWGKKGERHAIKVYVTLKNENYYPSYIASFTNMQNVEVVK